MKTAIWLILCVTVPTSCVATGASGSDDSEGSVVLAILQIRNSPLLTETEVEAMATELADEHGEDVIPALATALFDHDIRVRQFAVRTIPQVGDRPAVMEALIHAFRDGEERLPRDAVSVIADLPGSDANSTATRIIKGAKSSSTTLQVLPLLELFGDEDTLSFIEERIKTCRTEFMREALVSVRDGLRFRLGLSSTEREEWDEQAVPYWRVPRDSVMWRGVVGGYYRKAVLLRDRGYRFSLPFLGHQLEKGDPLAAMVLGVQGDHEGRALLEAKLSEKGAMRDVCLLSLKLLDAADEVVGES